MRTLLTLIVLILYVGLFNLYIYELPRPYMSLKECKLLYNYLTVSMLIFFVADLKYGFDNWLHAQLNFICILSVIINFILIILTHHVILKTPVEMFFVFNGSIFATTAMILICSTKYGYHRKN